MLHNLISWFKIPLCWFGVHEWWLQYEGLTVSQFECSRCSATHNVYKTEEA